ncbi:hypothetical protein pb186bvf_004524 [Paramecium bursaria]
MGNGKSCTNNQHKNSRIEFVPHFYVKSRAEKIFKKCLAYPPNQTDSNLYLYDDDSVFIGSLKDGLRNGLGCQFWYKGQHYSGNFENDLFHGNGRFLYADHALYNGEWCEGKQNGQGILITANGGKFIGKWVNNKFTDDQGTYKWLNGWSFVGKFVDGQLVGRGSLRNGQTLYECEKIEFNSGYLSQKQIDQIKNLKIVDRSFSDLLKSNISLSKKQSKQLKQKVFTFLSLYFVKSIFLSYFLIILDKYVSNYEHFESSQIYSKEQDMGLMFFLLCDHCDTFKIIKKKK